MPKVSVYYFRKHDINTDEWPRSKSRATLGAIGKCGGEAITETAVDVEISQVDADGFLESDFDRE